MSFIRTQIESAYKKKQLVSICIDKIVWDKRIIGYIKKIYSSDKFDLDIIDELGQRTGVKKISFPSVKSLEIGGLYNDNLKFLDKHGFEINQSRPKYFSSQKNNLYEKLRELKETATLCTFYFGSEYSFGRVTDISEKEFTINNIGDNGIEDGTSAYDIAKLTKIRAKSNLENMIAFLHEYHKRK